MASTLPACRLAFPSALAGAAVILRGAVAGAEHGAAVANKIPGVLSCEFSPLWAQFNAILSAQEAGHGQDTRGLPAVCSQLDVGLFDWATLLEHESREAAGSVERFGSDKVIHGYRMYINSCGAEAPEDLDLPCPPTSNDLPPCFYGMVAALLCQAVMYALNPGALDDGVDAHRSATAIEATASLWRWLISVEKLLEFLDDAGWHFSLGDVTAVLDFYHAAFPDGADTVPSAEDRVAALDAAYTSRPWAVASAARARAEGRAATRLAAVASWALPPKPHVAALTASSAWTAWSEGRRPLLRLWAFGTHCAVALEPLCVLAALLGGEFELKVVLRGAQDYCKYLHPADAGFGAGGLEFEPSSSISPTRRVHDEYNSMNNIVTMGSGVHRNYIRDPDDFSAAFGRALREEGAAFREADAAFCSEPALICLVLHRAGKPVMGYFGAHIAFMVEGHDQQRALYREFATGLVPDPRCSFAFKAPYLSQQLHLHAPVRIPAIRPTSLYMGQTVWTGNNSLLMVSKRPYYFWDVPLVLMSFFQLNRHDWAVLDAAVLGEQKLNSYSNWAMLGAAVYYPYCWLQTMTIYDFVNLGIPTFVPDNPLYSFSFGTNLPGMWTAKVWDTPRDEGPYEYDDFHDFEGRLFWWAMTDFRVLPGVTGFRSLPQLAAALEDQEGMAAKAGLLHRGRQERIAEAAVFWRAAAIRALAPASASYV